MTEKSLIEILKAHIVSGKAQLPAFDRTALVIQQEMAKPEPEMQIIEKQIIRDPALTSQLLKAANSPFYRGTVEVTTVRNAIVRLGLAEVSNLVTMLVQRKTFTSTEPFIKEHMNQLWLHSVVCAMGAKWLARECRLPGLINEAFFAGLLHDIGKAFLLVAIGNLRAGGQMPTDIPQPFIEEVLASLHPAMGAQLLTLWNLPEIYCRVARHHHDATFAEDDTVLIMVSLANKALAKRGIGVPQVPGLDLASSPESALLHLSETTLAELELALENHVIFVRGMD